MSKQQRGPEPTQAPQTHVVQQPDEELETQEEDLDLTGNAAMQSMVGGGGGGTPPLDDLVDGSPGDLPYRAEMESQFGTDFAGLEVYLDQADAMATIGARGAYQDGTVAFADASPDKELVAHELTHHIQGKGGLQTKALSGNGDAAEKEADQVASQVAAGEQAGPIGASGQAGIQRDEDPAASGNPVQAMLESMGDPKDVDESFGKFRVVDLSALPAIFVGMADSMLGALKSPDGRPYITARGLQEKRLFHVACDKLKTEIKGKVRDVSPFDFAIEVSELLKAFPDEVKDAVYADTAFLSDPAWKDHPELLLAAAEQLDPLRRLSDGLILAITQGYEGDKALADIKRWAAGHPGDCERALADSRVMGLIDGAMGDKKIDAIRVLMAKGGPVAGPVDDLKQALHNAEQDKFLEAWPKVSADSEAMASLAGDPNFLHQVMTTFGEDAYEMIAAQVKAAASEDASSGVIYGLSDDEYSDITGFANAYVKGLAEELDDTFVDEDWCIEQLEAYDSQVQSRLALPSDATPEQVEARKYKVNEARSLLRELYASGFGRNLDDDLEASLDSEEMGKVNSAAGIANLPEKKAAPELDENGQVVYPVNLEGKELTAVQAVLNSWLPKLYGEFTRFICRDAVVLGYFSSLQGDLRGVIKPADPKVQASKDAALARGKEAMLMVSEQYEARYGKSVGQAIADGMSGTDKKKAEDIIALGARVAETDAEYPPELSSDDYKRLMPFLSGYAGQVYGEMQSLVYVDDDSVLSILHKARSAVRERMTPPDFSPQKVANWEVRTDQAMARMAEIYDAQFGSTGGLVSEIHDHVQDGANKRECLRLIGNRADAAEGAGKDELLGLIDDAKDNGDADWLAHVSGLTEEIYHLAEELYSECVTDMICHDSEVERIVGEFETLVSGHRSKAEAKEQSPIPRAKLTTMLTRAYLELGGNLVEGIMAGVDAPDNAQLVKRLGLTPEGKAMADEDALDAVHADAQKEAERTGALEGAFSALRQMELGDPDFRSTFFQGFKTQMGRVATLHRDSPPDQLTAVRSAWETQHGINLDKHLGLVLWPQEAAEVSAQVPGLNITAVEEPSKKQAEGMPVSEIEFDFRLCSAEFLDDKDGDGIPDIAKKRAIELHENIQDRPAVNLILSRNGKPEENRIIRHAFKEIYGYELDFALKQAFGKGEDYQRLSSLAQTAGQEPFAVQIVQLAQKGSRNVIFERVYTASDEDKNALLDDPESMGKIRKALGEEDYDRVYRSLTGELTLDDMLRTRDTGQEWYTFGAGTDEDGTYDDIKLFFDNVKKELEKVAGYDPEAADSEAKTKAKAAFDAAFLLKCQEMFDDANVRAMAKSEFSSDELMKVRQLLMRGGEQTALDKAEFDMEGLGTGATILDNLKAMTDEERKKMRQDPTFLARLSGDMGGDQLQQALDILYADKGKEQAADVHGAINDSAVGNVDETKLFDTVLSMDAKGWEKLLSQPLEIARIRASLDDDAEERQMFDQMLEQARLGFMTEDESKTKVATKGGAEPEVNSDGSTAAEFKNHLVFKHRFALMTGKDVGREKTLSAAVACFKEKGEFTPKVPDGQTAAKREVFGDDERARVWKFVGTAIHEEYVKRSSLMDTLGAGETKKDKAFYDAVKGGVLGTKDPSGYRLEFALDGINASDDVVASAISDASDAFVVDEWSNVIKNGESGTSLQTLYTAYAADRSDMKAKLRFVDFSLDLAKGALDTLAQRDENYFLQATDAELLELKKKIRERIMGVNNDKTKRLIVVKALGLDPNSTDANIQDDIGWIVGDDRQSRSQHEHAIDDYEHQLGDGGGSIIDAFSDTDDAIEVSFAQYSGAQGLAETPDEGEDIGRVTKEELDDLNKRLAYFNTTISEYKSAKSAVAEALKWIAIAIITAVSAAFTGPAGPSLILTLVTAAGQAAVTSIIDEVVQGNDFDLGREGLKRVVVETGTAALTFGMGKAWTAASKKWEAVGWVDDAWKKWGDFEKALGDNAHTGFSEAMDNLMYNAVMAAPRTAYGNVKDGVLGSLDLSVVKYGWNDMVSNADTQMHGALDNLDKDVTTAIVEQLISQSGKSVTGALTADPKAQGTIPGVLPENAAPEKSAGEAFADAFSGKNMTKAGLDQGVGYVSSNVSSTVGSEATGKGGSNFFKASGHDADEISTQGMAFIKGRVTTGIGNVGNNAQTKNNAAAIAGKVAELESSGAFPSDPKLAELAKAAYTNYLKTRPDGFWDDVTYTDGRSNEKAEAWLTGHFQPTMDKIQKATGGSALDSELEMAYAYHVLSSGDLTKVDATVTDTPYETFKTNYAKAGEIRAEVQATEEYGKLSPTDQAFADYYMTNPSTYMDLSKGTVSGFDLRTDNGRALFDAALLETKKKLLINSSASFTASWPAEKKAAYTGSINELDATTLTGYAFSPSDQKSNDATASLYKLLWETSRDKTGAPTS